MSSLYRHLLGYFLLVSLVPLALLGLALTWDLEQRRHGTEEGLDRLLQEVDGL